MRQNLLMHPPQETVLDPKSVQMGGKFLDWMRRDIYKKSLPQSPSHIVLDLGWANLTNKTVFVNDLHPVEYSFPTTPVKVSRGRELGIVKLNSAGRRPTPANNYLVHA